MVPCVLQDYGIVTADDCNDVIERSKVRKEWQKYRTSVQDESASATADVRGIYFDDRNDKTLIHENVGG